MTNEEKNKLNYFIKSLYEESASPKELVNPKTGKKEIQKTMDFENKINKAFYINNDFRDSYFINTNNDIINEVNDWIDKKDPLKNIYISVNTFKFISRNEYEDNKIQTKNKKERRRKYSPFRRTKNKVLSSNAIFIDIDFYHIEKYKNKTAKEMYEIIIKEQSRFLNALGSYCFVCSGYGLYLFVKFDKTMYFLNDKYKNQWKDISNGINYRLRKYGADFKCKGDYSRIFRCPYTFNNKKAENKQAYIIKDFDNRNAKSPSHLYKLIKKDLDEINQLNKMVGSKSTATTGKGIKKETTHDDLNTVYDETLFIKNNTNDAWHITNSLLIKNLVHERLLDLDILLLVRNNELIGCRYYYFLIYASIYNLFSETTDQTYNCLVSINKTLCDPLDNSELIHIVNSISDNNLKITNQTIKEYLNITDGELSKLGLSYTQDGRMNVHNKINRQSYHNCKEKTKLDLKKETIINIIKDNSNASVKELMRLTGLSRAQLYRYKKKVA